MNALKLNVAIAAPALTLSVGAGVGTLPAATYFARVVPRMLFGPGGPLPGVANSTGELHNVAGAEASQAITLGQVLSISIPFTGGVTHYDVYIGTVTNTEIYCFTVPAALNQAATVLLVTAPLPVGGAIYTSVVASTVLPGNNFVAGGNIGGLNTQIPVLANPAVTPFIEGRAVCIANMTGGAINLNYSPDGVTAMALYLAVPASSIIDTSYLGGFGLNVNVSGLGGLPKFLAAASAGLFLLGGP